jgi:outer membrane receptor for ferrienterochelin and colicins
MRIIILSLAIIIYITLPLSAQEAAIKGRITDTDTHQPVAGANIVLDSLLHGDVSNANGQFSIGKISPGLHVLSVTYMGYTGHKQQVRVQNEDVFINLELKPSPNEIREVVITGTGTPHYIKNAPVQTEVFSQKSISSYAGNSIENLLGGLSTSFNFSANAMGSFMRLNGLGNEYILVLLNGKRLYGDVGSQNDLSRIDPASIERIEVVKGASSSLYGSDAIAGVINIITKKPGDPLNISNVSRIGSYGEWLQSNSVAVNRNKYQLTTNFSHSQSAGWKNNPYEIDKNSTPENPLDDTLEPTFSMTKNPMNSNSFKQNVTHQASKRLTLYGDAELSFRVVSPPVKAKGYRYLYHNQSYNMGSKYLFRNNGYISFDATYDRFKYLYRYDMKYNVNYINDDGEAKFITYYPGDKSLNNDEQKMSVNVRSTFKPNTRHNIVTGIDAESEWMEAPYRLKEKKVSSSAGAVYGQDEVTLTNSFIVTAGARLLYHNKFGQKLTPKVSLLYKLGQFNLRGTYAYGFKAPTLKELNYRYEREDMGAYRLYLGNPDLKPQISKYYSAAAEFNSFLLTTNVTVYCNNIQDMIEYSSIPTTSENAERGVEETRQYGNIASARILGIDALVSLNIGRHLLIGSSYSYTDAVNITQNCRLNGSLLHHANFRCEWKNVWPKYKLNIGLFGDMLSKQYGDALSENYYDQQPASAYMLWKINTTHMFAFTKRVKAEWALGVDNILNYVDDKPYGSNYGTTTPGRTYYISLNIKFANSPGLYHNLSVALIYN